MSGRRRKELMAMFWVVQRRPCEKSGIDRKGRMLLSEQRIVKSRYLTARERGLGYRRSLIYAMGWMPL